MSPKSAVAKVKMSTDSPSPLVNLLGTKLVTNTGEEIETATLAETKKAIVLYFSAHWCGPCRRFTPELSRAVDEYRKTGDGGTEVVFVSRDRDADAFAEYHREMSFPAVPYGEGRRLAERFGVGGIPCAVVVSPQADRMYGSVDVRALVDKHGAAALSSEKLREEDETIGFFDACMGGDSSVVKARLDANPGIANRACPEAWHFRYIRRGGWQPVCGGSPGVKNATGEHYLVSNFPAYGLQLAAGNGHVEIVRALVEAGANLEAEDGDGDTALAWATWCGRREMMEELIQAGADASFAQRITRQQFEAIKGYGPSLDWLKEKVRAAKSTHLL